MISFFAKKEAGIGLIEILVAAAVIGLSLSSLGGLGNHILKIQNRMKNTAIANYLAAETIEAIRTVKDENWDALNNHSAGAPFHPIQTSSPAKWSLAPNHEAINGFTRQIIWENVYRDGNDDITQAAMNFDTNTKKITAAVTWTEQGEARQISLSAYLTNWELP